MEHPLKILILEDSSIDAEIIQRLLLKQQMHCEFHLAMNKKKFLLALDEFFPDVILSDNSLPGFNATDALKITHRLYPHIPFILVTGTVSEEYAANIIKEGADDYVLKDRMARLPAAIGAALNQRKIEKEIADYRYALDQSAIVAITDQKGIILYANENFCKISKYTVEELIGQDHRIINSGYHPASYIKNLWITIANGKIWSNEFRNRAKDGSFYWVDTTIVPFLNQDGKPYQYLSIRKDITEKKKIEEQLIQSEEKYRTIFLKSPLPNWIFDYETLRFLDVNDATVRHYGYSREEFLSMNLKDIKPEEDVAELLNEMSKINENTDIRKGIWRHRKKNGDLIIVDYTSHPIAYDNKHARIAVINDITEKIKSEQELQAAYDRLSFHIENAPLGFIEWDNLLQVRSWSQRAEEIFGWTEKEFISLQKDGYTQVYEEDLPLASKIAAQLITGVVKNNGVQHRNYTKDGRVIWCEWFNSVLKDKNGKVITILSLVQDITERKKAEEALLHSELRLNEAQAIAHISNWEIDLVNNEHTWSDEFYRIVGLDKTETQPSAELFLSFMHPDNADFAQEKVREAFITFKGSSFDFRFVRKDGATRHGYTEWKFEFDKKGNPVRLFGILQDITERKEAAENLKLMEEKMLELKIQEQKKITRAILGAQETERNYIGRELHDNITQILAGTKMYLSIAGKKDANVKEANKYPMELIDSSIEELRLLSSKMVTPHGDINLQELIQGLLHSLQRTTAIKTELVYNLAGFVFDKDLTLNIYRIMQEQVNNITKYAEAKNVQVSITAANHDIAIIIMDDGKGFDVSKKRTGIGISNIINRVESFNGTVVIKSAVGKGSKIEIHIPC